jgi:hypothetical protein
MPTVLLAIGVTKEPNIQQAERGSTQGKCSKRTVAQRTGKSRAREIKEGHAGSFENTELDGHLAECTSIYLHLIVLQAQGNMAIIVSKVRCVVHERKGVRQSKRVQRVEHAGCKRPSRLLL